MELYEAPSVFERVINYDPVKEEQVRLVVNTFYGVEYIHLRKYYLDFNEEWQATPQGVAMPISIENTRELFSGLVEILSLAESKNILEEHFSDLLTNIYQPKNSS